MKEYSSLLMKKKESIKPWAVNLLPNEGLILDVGCAIGNLSKFVSKERYRGIDTDPYLVKQCHQGGLDAKNGDIRSIPFNDDTFAGVFCSHVIEHVQSSDQQVAMDEFFRVLVSGGILVLLAPTPYHWYFYDDPTHIRPVTHGSLEITAKNSGFVGITTFYSGARFLPKSIQRYLRIVPFPYIFWEVCLSCRKP